MGFDEGCFVLDEGCCLEMNAWEEMLEFLAMYILTATILLLNNFGQIV